MSYQTGQAAPRPGLFFLTGAAKAARGFTMVELVVVIVLTGILGAVATARYFDGARFDAAAYAEQTKSMLRYAQKIAVAQRRPVYVQFDSRRIALCFDTACAAATHVLAPAGANSGSRATVAACAAADWYCEGTPDGLAYTRLAGSAPNLFFDASGAPNSDPASPLFSGMVVRITGDGINRDVTVSPGSGYVY